jgi:xanthine dehydrogenase accessory factor
MRDGEDVIDEALAWSDEGRSVALATVVETWGSSPRRPGAQLAVRDDGLFVGSVSGGCVEGRVVEAAEAVMREQSHRLLELGVSNDEAWEVGLACGGTVRIFVAPIVRSVLEEVRAARDARRGIVVLTPLDGGPVTTRIPLATDEAKVEGSVFVQPFHPPLQLVIVGAVHIAESLVKVASVLGYDVTIVDPRAAFARAERWPGSRVFTAYPDEVLATMSVDHRTAIVVLSHDPKIDDPALEAALASDAFYIGALGSKKTHASRLERLASRGFDAAALARIHGPIGLPIGARSPAEIAVAIAAQMTELLRKS